MQILQIGRSHQAYLDYGELRRDSIWNAAAKGRKSYGEIEADLDVAFNDTFSKQKLVFDRARG